MPPPSSTSSTEPRETTSTIDFSEVPLTAAEGVTTTTLLTTGDVILTGTVTGEGGPVPGARVRVQRLVGDGVQELELLADEFGAWVIEGLPGGRFRVRAFLPPTLTDLDPAVFYAEDGEARDVPIRLTSFVGAGAVAGVTPEAPTAGEAANLAVRLFERFVDENGIGQTRPLPGRQMQLSVAGYELVGSASAVTDDAGVVLYELRCPAATDTSAVVVAGSTQVRLPLDVPPCSPRPTTTAPSTTAAVSSPSTTAAPTATSTSAP